MDLNHWGFPQRALNILAYDCIDKRSSCNETEHLREDFRFLVDEVLETMKTELEKLALHLNITTLEQWKDYPCTYEESKKLQNYDNLKSAAENFAMVNHQNESIGLNMTLELWNNFAENFAKFDNFEVKIISSIFSSTLFAT